MAAATMTMPTESPSQAATAPSDDASRRWLRRLRATGAERDAAVTELHDLLLRAARFEIGRRASSLTHLRGSDHDDLAQQSADDALVALLGKLDDFRGESRFTTWAYKFALLEAAVKLRTRPWHLREIPLEAEGWERLRDTRTSLAGQTEVAELIDAVRDGIAEVLTPHQRSVLVALTLNDVPIDVLAERH
ncbi:MAG TPA: hypothetical protein VF245_11785, partial [Solirubrobacterales bacterium]